MWKKIEKKNKKKICDFFQKHEDVIFSLEDLKLKISIDESEIIKILKTLPLQTFSLNSTNHTIQYWKYPKKTHKSLTDSFYIIAIIIYFFGILMIRFSPNLEPYFVKNNHVNITTIFQTLIFILSILGYTLVSVFNTILIYTSKSSKIDNIPWKYVFFFLTFEVIIIFARKFQFDNLFTIQNILKHFPKIQSLISENVLKYNIPICDFIIDIETIVATTIAFIELRKKRNIKSCP